MKIKNNSGFVLLEALIAVGLLVLFLGSLGTLFFLNLRGTALINNANQADLLARGNLEALRTIDFDDLALINPAHLVFSNPSWTATAGSAAGEVFTQTVRVKEVQRDGSCNVVAISGTVDPDSKFIESEVSWVDDLGRTHQTLLSSLITRWDDPQGPCFAPKAAASLIFHIETTLWYGGKQLREVYLENGGSEPIIISSVIFTWDNSQKIQQIFLDSNKLWSFSGPGSPAGTQASGTRLDVVDYSIDPGEILDMNKTQFTGAMTGATLTLTIEFTDGSIFTSDPFTPL